MNELDFVFKVLNAGGIVTVAGILYMLLKRADANAEKRETRMDAAQIRFDTAQVANLKAFEDIVRINTTALVEVATGQDNLHEAVQRHESREESWMQNISEKLSTLANRRNGITS